MKSALCRRPFSFSEYGLKFNTASKRTYLTFAHLILCCYFDMVVWNREWTAILALAIQGRVAVPGYQRDGNVRG